MKIAIVYDAIYPYIIGGVQKRNWELARRLVQRGHEVTLFGMKSWEGDDIIYKEGVRLYGVCPHKEQYTKEGRRSITQAIYFAWKVLPALLRERFDIIDCQNFPYFPCFSAKLASLIRRSHLVITWHEIWDKYWYEYLGRIGIFGKLVEMLVTKLAQMNIVGAKCNMDKLISMGVKQNRIKPYLIGGICFKNIQNVPFAEEKYDLIFVGRLIKSKGVDTLLHAVTSLRRNHWEGRVAIIGDGPERENLESLSRELGIQDMVKFYGRKEDDKEVISLLKSAKVFVYPEVPEGGWAITILEASACGLPVVSVASGALGDNEVVIDRYNGLLIDRPSAQLMSEKIRLILENEALRKELGKNGVDFAKEQDWDIITEKLLRLYYSCLIGGQNGR